MFCPINLLMIGGPMKMTSLSFTPTRTVMKVVEIQILVITPPPVVEGIIYFQPAYQRNPRLLGDRPWARGKVTRLGNDSGLRRRRTC